MPKTTKTATFLAIVLTLPATTAALASSTAPIACGAAYTVASGDTLSQIYSRAYSGGPGYRALHDANRSVIGGNPNAIFVGQVFDIPCQLSRATARLQPATQAPVQTADAAPAPAPAAAEAAPTATVADTDTAVTNEPVVLVFNKASGGPFIINTGIIDLYLAEITEVTEGRVTFVDPPEMNRSATAQLGLVTSGTVDGAYVFNGYLTESHPLLQLPMLPMMGGSAGQTAVSLWNLHETYLAETDYFDDVHLLGFAAAPAAHIWRVSDMPVDADDNLMEINSYPVPYFAGLDTRGPSVVQMANKAWLQSAEEAGQDPMTFFMAHGAARAAGIWNDDMMVTEVDYGVYTPTFSIVLSNDAWDRISDADQEAIMEISGEKLAHRSASWDAFDAGFRNDMLEAGLKTEKASGELLAYLENWSDTGTEMWKEQAEALGIPADEAVQFYRDELDRLQDRLVFR
ncbi:MAG: hypothetical protein AAGA87_11575 [Pseudomonadota bacterium]